MINVKYVKQQNNFDKILTREKIINRKKRMGKTFSSSTFGDF